MRLRELRELNAELDGGARVTAKELKVASEQTAERIIREAEDRANEMLREATESTRALVTDAEDRMKQIRVEREAVAGYFESLRSVLSQAERVSNE